jgi:hypothetical protein
MGWATPYINDLKAGKVVTFRPHGNSMLPRIQSGQLCTVAPPRFTGDFLNDDLKPGEVVLCRVKGREYLHFISKVKGEGRNKRFLIANAKGRYNGWIGITGIYGVLLDL